MSLIFLNGVVESRTLKACWTAGKMLFDLSFCNFLYYKENLYIKMS